MLLRGEVVIDGGHLVGSTRRGRFLERSIPAGVLSGPLDPVVNGHCSGGSQGRVMGSGALSGLRIIDAGTMIGGPFAGTLAADHGADVVKIEHPDGGDPIRQWSPMKDGVSLWWKVTGRNKRLVTLDLRTERGRELFLRLVERSDAVIENFRPGTFERWGLSYAELSRVNPRLVLVRVSGYGQTGPYAHRPGYGTVAEAMTGLPSFTGFPDGRRRCRRFRLRTRSRARLR